MSQQQLHWARWLAAILAAATAYATVRYHFAQPEPWSRFFFWTTNKAFSFAAAGLLAACYLYVPRDRRMAKALGLSGFSFALAHSLLSWPLFHPANYPKLYQQGSVNDAGLQCIWTGIAAIVLLCSPALASLNGAKEKLGLRNWTRFQRLGYAALVFTALHVLAIGYQGWLTPRTWPAALPPITILSFALATVPVALRLVRAQGAARA